MDVAYLVVLALFGAAFGSFANVVIWRFPRGESLSVPPSHCPSCDARIAWRDNVPVLSWFLLRGRCRSCGTRISPRYPIVESLSALLWVVAGIVFGMTPAAGAAVFLFYLLMILSFIDIDLMRLPNALVGALGGVGLLLAGVSSLTGLGLAPLTPAGGIAASPLVAAVIGSLSAGGVSLLIAAAFGAVRGRAGLGMGDVKLLLALGPFLGVYAIGVLFLGSLFGALWGIFVVRKGGKEYPFGPFLAIAAVLIAIWGPGVWTWYAGVVGMA